MKLRNFLTAAISAYIGILITMPNLYSDARILLLCAFIGMASACLDYVWLEDLNPPSAPFIGYSLIYLKDATPKGVG